MTSAEDTINDENEDEEINEKNQENFKIQS